MQGIEWLYLIEAVGCKAVKIGRAINFRQRFGMLQVGNHAELRIVGLCERADMEREVHSFMERYRIRGEWFIWNRESKRHFAIQSEWRGLKFIDEDWALDREDEERFGTNTLGSGAVSSSQGS